LSHELFVHYFLNFKLHAYTILTSILDGQSTKDGLPARGGGWAGANNPLP